MEDKKNNVNVEMKEETKTETIKNTGKKDISWFFGKIKSLNKKVLIIVGSSVLAATITLSIVLSAFSNTYRTPIKYMEKIENIKKSQDIIKLFDCLNGFTEEEFKDVFEILEDSDSFEDIFESLEDSVESFEDEYGENYKVKYKIEDKEKLEDDDLEEFEDNIQQASENFEEIVEVSEDTDSDEWEEICDESGLSKSQLKKLLKHFETISKKWSKAKVTKGYELSVVKRIKSSELDELEEEEMTIHVYKVNGRWIAQESLSVISLFYLLY